MDGICGRAGIMDLENILDPAIWDEAAKGDPRRLTAWLRSSKPLTEADRENLALLIERRLEPNRRGRGAPKKLGVAKFISKARTDYLRDEFRRRRKAGEARATVLEDMAEKYGKSLEYIINVIER